jgi:hypothetical protein
MIKEMRIASGPPAAALDASAEDDLFERYATSAGQAGQEDGAPSTLAGP